MKNRLFYTYTTVLKDKSGEETGQIWDKGSEETEFKTLKDLFKQLKGKGKVSKMCRDSSDGSPLHVGYILRYQDTTTDGEKYTREDWLELCKPVKVMREVVDYFPITEKVG